MQLLFGDGTIEATAENVCDGQSIRASLAQILY